MSRILRSDAYLLLCSGASPRPVAFAIPSPFLLQPHQIPQCLHLPRCEGTSWLIPLGIYCSQVYKYIFFGVITINGTTSITYIEPFCCSQNLLVHAGRHTDVRPRQLWSQAWCQQNWSRGSGWVIGRSPLCCSWLL